jgi:ribonucleoside-diphosphate reductase alpha chain
MKFLPAGRVQLAIGSKKNVTAMNCFVSGNIDDSIDGIMKRLWEAAIVLKMGGGIGYNFSSLRPRGDLVHSVDGPAGGPVHFMQIYDAMCRCIASTGNRRGAQMAVLNVDHPDIESFIYAKQDGTSFPAFNLSVGVTDDFMRAVEDDAMFDLKFDGRVYSRIKARVLWDKIMRSTWDWSEPGILFLDTINRMNNLYYLENIECTNPCGEQCLPPYGSCLLGSFNLTKYLLSDSDGTRFDYQSFIWDIPVVVRAMDNVIDASNYPIDTFGDEAILKRRMGIGITGLANSLEAVGHPYGSPEFVRETENIMRTLMVEAYRASVELSKEKGAFPLFDDRYLGSNFVRSMLPDWLRDDIRKYGIRNSHLVSVAPTGTMSLCADNVSSSIEPVFSYHSCRVVRGDDGDELVSLSDYGVQFLGVYGVQCKDVPASNHLAVLAAVQKYADASVSKTCNVGDDVKWEVFKDIYMKAWKMGCKGCTTFRLSGKRRGIMEQTSACYMDLETGRKVCDE